MAYEIQLMVFEGTQFFFSANPTAGSPHSTSGGATRPLTNSQTLTLRVRDDDDLLNTLGGDDSLQVLDAPLSYTFRGEVFTLPEGTPIALTQGTRLTARMPGSPLTEQFVIQGLLVQVNGTWQPLLSNSQNNMRSGVYAIYRANTGSYTTIAEGSTISYVPGANPVGQRNQPGYEAPYTVIPELEPEPDCFTPGTMIDTPDGPRRIEDLGVGDRVLTRDHGAQVIRWTGRQHVSAARLDAAPNLRPVLIRAGALGPGVPGTDLVVSPQHRLLLTSRIVARVAGAEAVLAPARQLIGWPGIEVLAGESGVTYLHLMLARHEVIRANGAWSESLYLGPRVTQKLTGAARREIAALFPELLTPGAAPPPPARPLLRGKPLREIMRRAERNRRSLVE